MQKVAENAETHVCDMDAFLSSLLDCRIYIRGVQPGSFEDDFALRVYAILRRLPSRPLKLADVPPDIDRRYFWDDETSEVGSPAEPVGSGTWGSLRVAASLSVTIIQMALYIVISGTNTFGHGIQEYPNVLAELLETSSGLVSQCISTAEQRQWFIVRAALWSSWQRSGMLCHNAFLKDVFEFKQGLTPTQGQQ